MNEAEIQTEHHEGIGRFYKCPRSTYPSVTTVLSAIGGDAWLEEWREKVGEEFADAYTKNAADIGTHMHLLFECYLGDEDLPAAENEEQKIAERMFNRAKAKARKLIQNVVAQEKAVWSDKFRIAGRFDLLCVVDGELTLLDFKTTKREKKREDIDSYRLQLAFYSIMIQETLGLTVNNFLIFMVNRDGFVQLFRFSRADTKRSELVEVRKKFFDKFGK